MPDHGGNLAHFTSTQGQFSGPLPDDFLPQADRIIQIVAAMGIPVLEHSNYEADDVLATMARVVDELQGQCYLVTNDKDCRQLITDRVSLYRFDPEFFLGCGIGKSICDCRYY